MPMVIRWPGHVKPGVTKAMVSQVDFLASFAKLTGQPLTASDAPDSFDVLAALLGQSQKGRDSYIEYAGTLAIREGNWKFIQPSNGSSFDRDTRTELGNSKLAQLYNVEKDPGEKNNVAQLHPDIVERLSAKLAKLVKDGHSRPISLERTRRQ